MSSHHLVPPPPEARPQPGSRSGGSACRHTVTPPPSRCHPITPSLRHTAHAATRLPTPAGRSFVPARFSFQAKWTLPNGGSLLGQDILWETRVRYVTPPYFWFALWTSGNKWDRGAEMDLIESFGFDNGGGFTNFDGHLWHSDGFGTNEIDYASWPEGMAEGGIASYDASDYHVWQWLYRKDDRFSADVDGHESPARDDGVDARQCRGRRADQHELHLRSRLGSHAGGLGQPLASGVGVRRSTSGTTAGSTCGPDEAAAIAPAPPREGARLSRSTRAWRPAHGRSAPRRSSARRQVPTRAGSASPTTGGCGQNDCPGWRGRGRC
jgi:hypothetical protein